MIALGVPSLPVKTTTAVRLLYIQRYPQYSPVSSILLLSPAPPPLRLLMKSVVLGILLLMGVAVAQNGEMDRFNRAARPMHQDVPYISCATCKRAVEELWKLNENTREHIAKEGLPKLGEDDLIELAESVCDPDTDEGEWMCMIDIEQEDAGMSVKLKQEEYMGECRRECRTLQHACNKVFDEHREDIAELLWKVRENPQCHGCRAAGLLRSSLLSVSMLRLCPRPPLFVAPAARLTGRAEDGGEAR